MISMLTEARLQYEIVMWAQSAGYYCFHCPNGEKRDSITASKLMAMGVKAGVPDLIFILPDGKVAWVELKLKKGKLSKVQEKFRIRLLEKGQHYILVQSDLKEEATDYLGQELAKICHPE
jgi:hypothetical protein